MTAPPRYQTLRDYLRVVRTHRVLIAAIALALAIGCYALSSTRPSTYATAASISFRQGLADSELLGGRGEIAQDGSQPLINEQLTAQTATLERVRRDLGTERSVEELRGLLGARVEEQTALLVIQARSEDPRFAARLANAVAEQVAARVTREARQRYGRAADAVRRRVRALRQAGSVAVGITQERLARFETLRDVARPAEVVRRAETPRAPVSPRPFRDALLGLLVGFTLGLLIAFLRDVLDRRLRDAKDIEDHLDLPVVGHVNQSALGGGLVSANGEQGLSEMDLEAFRILRTNIELSQFERPPRTLAVTSGLPEEGKSTVATALASVNVAAGKSTVLVECDMRRPSLAARFGVSPGLGLSDYLSATSELDEVIQQVAVVFAVGGPPRSDGAEAGLQLACITAGTPARNPAEALGSDRFRGMIDELSRRYDTVVLDTCPLLSVADTRKLLPLVDVVLLCVRASQTTREEASAAKQALEHLPPRSSAVVVTGVPRGTEGYYGYYSYEHAYSASQ